MIFTFSFCSLTINQYRLFFFFAKLYRGNADCVSTDTSWKSHLLFQAARILQNIFKNCDVYVTSRNAVCPAVSSLWSWCSHTDFHGLGGPINTEANWGYFVVSLCFGQPRTWGGAGTRLWPRRCARPSAAWTTPSTPHAPSSSASKCGMGNASSWGLPEAEKWLKNPQETKLSQSSFYHWQTRKGKLRDCVVIVTWLHLVGCDRASQQIWVFGKLRCTSIISYVTSISVLSAGVGSWDSE